MKLVDVLKGLSIQDTQGKMNVDIKGISSDSRRVSEGYLFVALRGEKDDGYDYIIESVERGAAAVVSERNFLGKNGIVKIRTDDSRSALATISANFYGHPSRDLLVIGITGTNGKTTVSLLSRAILEQHGLSPGLIGTIAYQVGERKIPVSLTTPESVSLQSLLAEMVRAGCDSLVIEVSSHALSQKRVEAVDFDIGVFTNATADHLDYHGTREAYIDAKMQLFKMIERIPGRSSVAYRAIVNRDDSTGQTLAKRITVNKLLYGLDNKTSDISVEHCTFDLENMELSVVTSQGNIRIISKLIGYHNAYNILAAIGVGIALNIPLETVAAGIEKVSHIPGRLERVDCNGPMRIFVDYAHTEDALCNVLKTLRTAGSGSIILVFGCGGDRDTKKRPLMGRVAGQLADFSVITSDNPRTEDPQKILREIAPGFERNNYVTIEERREAIACALRRAGGNDVVLIAGKGHEGYQILKDTTIPFDDVAVAQEIVKTI